MRPLSGKSSFLLLVTFCLACGGGCAPADHWAIFTGQPAVEGQLAAATSPIMAPVEFEATATEPPAVAADVDIPA